MYYHLKSAPLGTYEQTMLVGVLYNGKKEIVSDVFDAGISIQPAHDQENFTVVVDEKESFIGKWGDTVYNFVQDAGSIFIVSEETVHLFRKLGLHNLEFYNLTIVLNKQKLTNYKIVNVVGKIDCINDDKSEMKVREDKTIKSVTRLAFDEQKIPEDIKIFLLARKNVAKIFVHQSVKDAIEEANLDGFLFTSVGKLKGRL